MNLDALCKQVIEVSEEVGNFLISQNLEKQDIEEKSLNNLVSYVDKQAELLFVSRLTELLPEAGFIAEEGTGAPSNSGLNWIIDPLDGTTNFIHAIPFYCTSVALVQNGELLIGVIHDPNHEHTFHAFKSGGAWLNSREIKVNENQNLQAALLATGFPYDDFGRQDQYMELLKDFTQNTRGIRRLGSAALDLAYVAWGKFDSFYEYGLNPWDVAAGILIVQEAGGICSG
ncbi:MAG: inositol monophosphatase family protein, partial [Flavobacteriales bacterium]